MPVSKKKKHKAKGGGKKRTGPPPSTKTEIRTDKDSDISRALQIGLEMGRQQMLDMLFAVLGDKDIMRKDVFGSTRIVRVTDGLKHYLDEVFPDILGDAPTTKAQREELDALLLSRVGPDLFDPFMERYPYCKKVDE